MITVYEGNEPYLFISYAHKDAEKVMPILELLGTIGSRIWYDAGIETGSSWPDYIATRLENSTGVLCFLSEHYNASNNCREEHEYAKQHKKQIVYVVLQQYDMSPGMRMQTSEKQVLICDSLSDEQIVEKLCKSNIIQNCGCCCSGAGIQVSHVPQKPKNPLLKRAFLALEDAEWDKATEYCEKVLDTDPENGEAYLVKLLAELKLTKAEDLSNCTVLTAENRTYQKVIRFCNTEFTRDLAGYLEQAERAAEEMRRFQSVADMKNGVLVKYRGRGNAVVIPRGITAIDSCAFMNCDTLLSVTIPEGVTELGVCAFKGCSELLRISIPNSLTKMKSGAFAGCFNLQDLLIPQDHPCFRLVDGCLMDIRKNTLVFVTGYSVFPQDGSVAIIGDRAFWGCDALTDLQLPAGVTKIDIMAFSHCEALTSVTIPQGVTDIEEWAFFGCDALTSVTIPDSVTYIENSAFDCCDNL
ncbi:MAG: leucine-rich repeat protein, partial [Oscillospiraceae bacterium]|nr:leucine-rich repeat protein [Oscillospiraceae bacterium]